LADAVTGDKTPQQAMDSLAEQQDKVLERLQKSGIQGECGPKLNEAEGSFSTGSNLPGAPQAETGQRETQRRETVDYDELVKSWAATKN
jgi:glycerol transport system substrate-binding protein